jgi:hypothetical protein
LTSVPDILYRHGFLGKSTKLVEIFNQEGSMRTFVYLGTALTALAVVLAVTAGIGSAAPERSADT